ncbi:hypothetical protein D3C72_1136560 [compost metagenome]
MAISGFKPKLGNADFRPRRTSDKQNTKRIYQNYFDKDSAQSSFGKYKKNYPENAE